MTAHIVYTKVDPYHPATQSPDVIRLIRDDLGIKGILMTDDISMNALSGTVADRGAAALAAGCDVILHCNGDLAQMQSIAALDGRFTAAEAPAAGCGPAQACGDPRILTLPPLGRNFRLSARKGPNVTAPPL